MSPSRVPGDKDLIRISTMVDNIFPSPINSRYDSFFHRIDLVFGRKRIVDDHGDNLSTRHTTSKKVIDLLVSTIPTSSMHEDHHGMSLALSGRKDIQLFFGKRVSRLEVGDLFGTMNPSEGAGVKKSNQEKPKKNIA